VPPTGGFRIQYQLQARDTTYNVIGPPSASSTVRLTLRDGTIDELPLPIADVCVYKTGQDQFCRPFSLTLTPSGPGPTTTPTRQATALPTQAPTQAASPTFTEGPTEVPTGEATASATVQPTGALFIPVAKRKAR
jgi:hypothetical protein